MNQIAYLECRDGIHNKFYLMTMTDPCGVNFTIRWGRIGTEGSSCLQPVSNWNKKLHERLSHGYVDRTQDYLDGKINGPAAWTGVGGAKYKMTGTRKVEVKIQEHITVIKHICKILPISLVRVETAEFDTQRLKAMLAGKPLPVGTDYQLGEMYDEYNVRQYVLKRDHYTCQCCGAHNTAKKVVKLHVHHLESRKTGGNAPSNLVTLCTTCHKNLHKGRVTLDGKERGKPLRDATFMGVMRKTLMARLKEELPIPVQGTYGYITKMRREQNDIKKSHTNDARCISKHPLAEPCSVCYRTKAIRHHNRQTHKVNFSKGGYQKRSQTPYLVEGYRLWDKVLYKGQECFVSGRRSSGSFALKKLDGTSISKGVTFKKLRLLEPATNYLIERM